MQIDFLDPNTYDADMWERFSWCRENDPLYWDEGNELFVATTHRDVSAISKNSRLFCSEPGTRPGMPVKLSILDMDEPRHGQLRGLINKGFTPRMVAKLEDYFRKLTTAAIDRVAPKGECDFVQDIAVPLPLELIAELIGIDKSDRARFHRWSDDMMNAEGQWMNQEAMATAGAAFNEYIGYLEDIFESRHKEPKDDLVSILVGAKQEGLLGYNREEFAEDVVERLGSEEAAQDAADELRMFMVALLVAGNETTRNAISGGISALIENPGQRQKLMDNPAMTQLAADEIVRYVSPVLSFARTATADTELRGKTIEKGRKVLMIYPSANRDAAVFENPDAFIVDRDPNPHLGFGIGNHFCLGANLARMEVRVVLDEVLRRMADMEYTNRGPEMHPHTLVRSFVHMPVRFTPEDVGHRAA